MKRHHARRSPPRPSSSAAGQVARRTVLFTLAVLVAGWLLVAGLAPLPLLGTEAVKAALRHRAFQPLVGRLSRS